MSVIGHADYGLARLEVLFERVLVLMARLSSGLRLSLEHCVSRCGRQNA